VSPSIVYTPESVPISHPNCDERESYTPATMAQVVAKYAAKKMLSSEMNKYKDKKVESEYVCLPESLACECIPHDLS
jgi:hypothetical protein